ncbi:MAG: Gfo/Idh/MocA family oxidoreductase, partial [Smithellaceae bacterium]|nr:Gfo/Idh/MocA family oxidoreductase [Smithellaceae bacterium]
MNKINVGVIGAGRIGRIHARNIKFRIPGAKLFAVADVNLEAAQRVASELEVPDATGDYRQLLK